MKTPAPRRRLPLALTAVGTALALAACGAEEASEEDGTPAEEEQQEAAADTVEWRNGPIPDEEPGVAPEELDELRPEGSDDLAETLGARATDELTRTAGVIDEDATWDCPSFEHEEGEQFTCTVTFLGEDFEQHVELGEVGGYTTRYQSALTEMPVVRDHVEDSIRHQAEAEDVYCDMDPLVRVSQEEQDELDTLDIDCHALVDGEADEWVVAPHMQGGIVVAPGY
ncbi:hypothetical protein [Nocardiopsis xinjiangensis]|uniref:hypothetical protein n=1 Tax=Nocardiopsis xinjiangensis TaxID=124285 RepID=UPI0003457ECA|nr:hypothetical protein [Nocardiopsis xinjiangensis]